jgi:hypothetical protein
MPALAEPMRRAALPLDVTTVIRIAGGCAPSLGKAVQRTGQSRTRIVEACGFYLQQVLLHPAADSHRVLGLGPGASRSLAREHRNWLLKWLHPDVRPNGWEAIYAQRVVRAWRELNEPGRAFSVAIDHGASQLYQPLQLPLIAQAEPVRALGWHRLVRRCVRSAWVSALALARRLPVRPPARGRGRVAPSRLPGQWHE